MATTPTLLSMEEYLRTSYHPDADYVDGELEERNLGQFEHARLQWLIGVFFGSREAQWSIRGVTEQRIRISEGHIRVCDLALLRADAPREHVLKTPPLLCIEIMSPEDRIPRAVEVLKDYVAMGVENVWLIDPVRRTAYVFDADGLHETDPTQLRVPDSPIHLDLTEAFAAID